LKDEGIIEKTRNGVGFLPSKYKNAYWRIQNGGGGYFVISDFQNTNNLSLSERADLDGLSGVLNAKETQSLLDKLDDGLPNTGLVRACEFEEVKSASCDEATPESLSEADNTNTYALVSKLDF
ncbi:MAG: hypothetical protein LBG48_01845, partial [Rickettsiales bacterium]|nr:hypothetical protein [Rickettsiales bacterium]